MKTKEIIFEILLSVGILLGGALIDLELAFFGVVFVGICSYLMGRRQMKRELQI